MIYMYASLVLLMIALLGGCLPAPPRSLSPRGSDQPTGAPPAQPTPRDELQTWTLPTLNLALDAPLGWRLAQEDDSFRLLAPAGDVPVLVEPLHFRGQGDTFLAAVERAAQQDPPQERRYLSGDDGQRLGELLLYPERLEAFLQTPRGDWHTGARLTGPRTETVLAIISSARPLETGAAAPTDVEIEFVRARQTGDGVWSFDVRLRHPDLGWEDYTDGWQIATPDGAILDTRILLHPHVQEQPFTRSLGGVVIDPSIDTVLIVAHDLVSGYTQDGLRVPLSRSGTEERYQVER